MKKIRKSPMNCGRGAWSCALASSLFAGLLSLATTQALSQTQKPAPDVIVFTNGDQLTGTLERAMGNSFTFKSDMAGEITVTADKIKTLTAGGKFVALKKDEVITRTSKQPGSITYADNVVNVASTSSTSAESVPVKDLAFLIDGATFNKEVLSNPGFLHGWSGSLTGGITDVASTISSQNYSLAVNLIRAIPTVSFLPPRTRTTFNLLETYGKISSPVLPAPQPPPAVPVPNTVVKTNIFHADAEHDKYFNSRLYVLGDLSYDHNYAQGLNLQQIYGVGVGYTVLQTQVQELDTKVDVHYEKQSFTPPGINQNLIGSSFSESYHRNLPRKIVFTESGTFIPAWNDISIYSAIFDAGLDLPTYKRFSFSLSMQDSYLSNPVAGYQNNSYQFITGITYALK